jgi:hypothetical protein
MECSRPSYKYMKIWECPTKVMVPPPKRIAKLIRYHDAKDSNPQTGLSLLLKEF